MAQWVQTDGPYGNTRINGIFFHDTIVHVATDCGLFAKSANADRWTYRSPLNANSFSQRGSKLIAGSDPGGIWIIDLTQPDEPPLLLQIINVNAVSLSDSCFYAGNRNQGFFKLSEDNSRVSFHNQGLPVQTNWHPAIGNYNIYVISSILVTEQYIYAGTNKGIYRTTGMLDGWVHKSSGLPDALINGVYAAEDLCFAIAGTDIYYSPDDGENWELFFAAPSQVTAISIHDDKIMVGTKSHGIFLSNDQGQTWSTHNTGLSDMLIQSVFINEEVKYCGTGSQGLFRLDDNDWVKENEGMICSNVYYMASSDSYMVASYFSGVSILEENSGWKDISPDVPHEIFGSVAIWNDTIFLSVEYNTAEWPFDRPYIIFSPDKGVNWMELINPVPFARDDPYSIYIDNGRLFAYEDELMYYTDDLGNSWTNISLSHEYCNYFHDLIVHHGQVYAAACGGGEFLILEEDLQWRLSNNGLPEHRSIQKLMVCGDVFYAYVSYEGVFSSDDLGQNWKAVSHDLEIGYGGIRDYVCQGPTLVITSEKGVFHTSDKGNSWRTLNNGLTNKNTTGIIIQDDTLYAGTLGSGVWKLLDPASTVSVKEHKRPLNHTKPYPNPANSFIIISGEASHVQIFDMNGRMVHAGKPDPSGVVIVSMLGPGFYIMSLQKGPLRENHKLLISR